MRRAGLWAWSLLVPAAMVGSNATACSVRASYRIPTTLQVVDQADAVVLARVVDGGPTADAYLAGLGARRARFDPFAAIKGNVAVDRIMFDEALLEVPGSDLTSTPSDPRNLVDVNPEAFKGSCNRGVFKPGMIVVLFLRRSGEQLTPLAPPFSRGLEDVPTADALWVKAVRMYVAIAAKPKPARLAEMRRKRDDVQAEVDDPDARLLALELDRALRNSGR